MGHVSENGSDGAHASLAVEPHADPQIIAMVRDGDAAAFEVLYRRHAAAAQFVARAQTDNASDADDVVSEAFASIFQALTEGKGPDQFFRSYLLTAVRRMAYDRNRKARRTLAVGDGAILDTVAVDPDSVLDAFESSTMAKAFTSLPGRWQAVLWHVDIEGLKPAAAAPFVGLSPNSVSSLAIRAREGLRQAYLQNHISLDSDDSCLEYSSQLGKYVRDGLKRTSREKVEDHLEQCAKCTALLMELEDVQAGMRAVVFPLVAGITFTPTVTAGFLPGTPVPETPPPGGPDSPGTGPRLANNFWKIAVAALILCGLAIAGGLIWLSQATPIVEPDAASSAPPAPPSALKTAPTASATSPTSPVPTSSDAPAIPVPQPTAPMTGTPPVTAPASRFVTEVSPTASAMPTPSPVPTSGPPAVTAPQPSTTSAPPSQTVTGSFAAQPGTGQPERQIDVAFSLHGDGAPTSGEAIFSLSPEAAFVQGNLLAPAGWTCTTSDIRQIHCTTSSIDPNSLGFTLDAMMSNQAQNATLNYQFGGQGIVTTTFTNVFS